MADTGIADSRFSFQGLDGFSSDDGQDPTTLEPLSDHDDSAEEKQPANTPAPVAGKARSKRKLVSLLSKDELADSNKAIKRSGVVYLSTIPTGLNKTKLQSIFSKFGRVSNIHLNVKEENRHKVKRSMGYITNFDEGWIEFADKKIAKMVVATFSGQPINSKKYKSYYGEIWMMKYLPKFKWHHLMEQMYVEKERLHHFRRTEIDKVSAEGRAFLESTSRQGKRRRPLGRGQRSNGSSASSQTPVANQSKDEEAVLAERQLRKEVRQKKRDNVLANIF
ncbi:RNA-binding ATPase activator esf2 [Dimargaris verticillata]|uniref:18S rRNA factor 2 n=1 Tax=Dimargaris verticillata TaxID=2761393 RepID=A0A9W8EBS2_9FUNG|nr:RNA-binding ATPase activator esf2 [Dimargaris verticillata]